MYWNAGWLTCTVTITKQFYFKMQLALSSLQSERGRVQFLVLGHLCMVSLQVRYVIEIFFQNLTTTPLIFQGKAEDRKPLLILFSEDAMSTIWDAAV